MTCLLTTLAVTISSVGDGDGSDLVRGTEPPGSDASYELRVGAREFNATLVGVPACFRVHITVQCHTTVVIMAISKYTGTRAGIRTHKSIYA